MPGRSVHSLIELRTVGGVGSFNCEVINSSDRILSAGQLVRIGRTFPAGNWIPADLQQVDAPTTYDPYQKSLGIVIGDDFAPGEVGLIAWAGRVAKCNVSTSAGSVVAGQLLRPHHKVPGACFPILDEGELHKRWIIGIAAENSDAAANEYDIKQIAAIILPWCL